MVREREDLLIYTKNMAKLFAMQINMQLIKLRNDSMSI
jgi:hypothetical protein